MKGDTVIVFARAPRLGAVKRRLARGIGAMAALRFYRGQLAATLRAVARDGRWRAVVAATPDRARWRCPLPRVPQGHGSLGARMARALARHRRAVIVGSDIPGIARSDIAAAFRALRRADAVFGPATDGGSAHRAKRMRRPAHPFRAVRWSTGHALADTLANFSGHRVALLRELRDVDTAADLRAIRGTA
jgi:hypothetical protein